MVKVRSERPTDEAGRLDVDAWLDRIGESVQKDSVEQIGQAIKHVKDITKIQDDESLLQKAMSVADILIQFRVDDTTLMAAILYPLLEKQLVTDYTLNALYGESVSRLIEGAVRIIEIRSRQVKSEGVTSFTDIEKLRKMLVAMVDDVRVILIKLAEQVFLIRAARKDDRDTQRMLGRETMDIYAPLANRLGIGQLKWELEDMAFRFLKPNTYKHIAKLLSEKRLDREDYLQTFVSKLNRELEAVEIKGEITGRAKHIYSIWRKMKRKGVGFEEIYDVRAVRVLVRDIRDCYGVLGVVHALWHHIPKEFDDYIADPKENGYQSLHTAVIGEFGKVVEIQIRTFQMDEDAEKGVAAHWAYKEAGKSKHNKQIGEKEDWLRNLLSWKEDLDSDSDEVVEALRDGAFEERIYVVTPKGDVVDLPKGATPIDFSYRIHSQIGHRCRGAKVNGRIAPLNHQLQTGDQVEVLTGSQESPSRDWLNPHLGYTSSARTRNKIQRWFKSQARDQNIVAGKMLLDKEIARLSIGVVSLKNVARHFNLGTEEDVYAAVGAGDLSVGQVVRAITEALTPHSDEEHQFKLKPIRTGHNNVEGFSFSGVGNLLTSVAGCCKPLPGEAIAGYITQNRGVVVHKQECPELLQLRSVSPERVIEVSWGSEQSDAYYEAEIEIISFDRSGLLRDITTIFANEKINVNKANTVTDREDNTATMVLGVEIKDLEQLGRVMSLVARLPNVYSVRRKS